MLEDPINSLQKFSKRICIFQEAFKKIRASEQKVNYNLGIFLTNHQRSYGPPILAEEIISIVTKYFPKNTLFCISQENNISKFNSNNLLTCFSKNSIFENVCEQISESFTRWIEIVIHRLVFDFFYKFKFLVFCCMLKK